ncbi:MAG TPA: metalloprotease TldD [Gammaproteobacteria bacterium]|nr:metalloprotease TldD [Gammaproteobacteria bacterium]
MRKPSKQVAPAPVDSFAIARELLLEGQGLELAALERALSAAMVRKLDYVDLYLQLTRYETWTVEDGIVKEGAYSVDQGIGVRAVSGERTGFAYSDQLDETALTDAVVAARGIARTKGGGSQKIPARVASHRPLYPSGDPLRSMTDSDKVALLAELDRRVRAMDSRVVQVIGSLSGVYEVVLVQATDGTLAADVRPLVRLNVSVIMEKDGRREQGYAGGGGRGDYTLVTGNGRPLELAAEAVRTAAVNLSAVPSPAGTMPVVLGSGWPGILLHEAIGHGLEGDFNRKGTSAFTGRIGERVATDQCTVVDDGTLVGRRGSLTVDDEGTPTSCNTLIESGILKGYMFDKLNARLMGVKSTGNGRRESFAHTPMPRMTNTYMLPGKYDPEEIIASVDRGIYAPNFGGGQVDITSGKFVFSASEAYIIENGKKTVPVKGAMLIGSGPEVLTRVSMVGNDLKLDAGLGTCGKDGQSVPVGVGQPTIRIDSLTVGGTQA